MGIADPSYFLGTPKVKATGKVVRKIAVLNAPIPNTKNGDSCQIIIPASAVTPPRKSDIYVCSMSFHHFVAAGGKFLAVLSTNAETADPEKELDVAMALLGPVEETFSWVTDSYDPAGDGTDDNCFITSSYDATTHFQTCSSEVLAMYHKITGAPLDLQAHADEE